MEGQRPSFEGLCNELLEEEQLLSQQTQSADAIRTPSDSSEGEPDRVSGLRAPSAWWAKLLRQHGTVTLPPGKPTRPVTVVSGCTGAAAEIAVFKAGGLCTVAVRVRAGVRVIRNA